MLVATEPRTGASYLIRQFFCSWAPPVTASPKDHRDYLAAGGLDFSIGDGQLNYGREYIIELFYRIAAIKGIYVTADVQEIINPTYNIDRGPVTVGALMVHTEL